MKWNTILLLLGLVGLGVIGATQASNTVAGGEERTTYWANGKLQVRSELISGVPTGHTERWYPDGTKQAEGQLQAGIMDGPWEFWRADGTPDVERTGTYRGGVRSAEGEAAGGGR